MELLQKTVKRFKDINYFCNNLHLKCLNLTGRNSFCKFTGSKTLVSMKRDSTGDNIRSRTLLKKSTFKVIEREKPSWMFS